MPAFRHRVTISLLPVIAAFQQLPEQAFPGFHLANEGQVGQEYSGGWRFSPTYGADISESGDRATFTFYGTDVALVVRRANFRARFQVEIDGQPANALPQDESGAAMVLTAADPNEDYLSTELVARNLPLGQHTLTLETGEIARQAKLYQRSLNEYVAYCRQPVCVRLPE